MSKPDDANKDGVTEIDNGDQQVRKYKRTPPETFTDRQCVEAYVASAERSRTKKPNRGIAAQIVSDATGKNCTEFRIRQAVERWNKQQPDPFHGGVVRLEEPESPGYSPTLEDLAALVNVDPSHVGRKKRASLKSGFAGDPFPEKVPGLGYSNQAFLQWWREHIDTAHRSGNETATRGDGVGPKGLGGAQVETAGPDATARKRAAEAELAEMKAAQMREKLLDRQVVEEALEIRTRLLIATMHKLRPEFAQKLAGLSTTGADAVLKDYIDRLIEVYQGASLLEEVLGGDVDLAGAA